MGHHSQTIQSNNSLALLEVPRTKLKYYGEKAGEKPFINAAPMLWNQLPLHLQQISDLNDFKCTLKTTLFKVAFSRCLSLSHLCNVFYTVVI